jgi:hypothetical protein
MLMGRDIRVEGAASQQFLEASQVIQDIYHSWHPHLHKVHIRGVTPVSRARERKGRVGLFFSCGVDSFYSLLKHDDDITDLIFIRGFEYAPHEETLLGRASRMAREAAAHAGKRVVELETNLRGLLVGKGLSWGKLSGGALTASLGLLLYPEFSRIYVAASGTYAHLDAWASHPLLDPLWSTDGLEFVHDGAEATRVEKVRLLAAHDWVLRLLRVCNRRPAAAPNCGRCEKCIRTMLNLLVAGALERGPSFEVGLDPRRVARMGFQDFHSRAQASENLAALESSKQSGPLAAALRTAINRAERRRLLRELARHFSPGERALLRIPNRLLMAFGLFGPQAEKTQQWAGAEDES